MSMDIRPTAAAPPEVRRVSYDEHARAVARDIQPDDPDRAGRTAALAVRLEPLQRIQVAFDQLVAHAAGRRRGEAWDYAGPSFAHYARDALADAIAAGDLARREADEEDRKAMEERTRARAEKLRPKAPAGAAPLAPKPSATEPAPVVAKPAPTATKPPESAGK
jgi:hypothetical protein